MPTTLKRSFSWPDPAGLKEHDNRPIAALHVSGPQFLSADNPAGWIFPQYPGTTLAQQMKAYADGAIAVMRGVGAQGGTFWNLEGNNYPQYIGAPDLITTINAEMKPLLGPFLKYFRDAGFRVGLCVDCFELNPNWSGDRNQTPLIDSPDPLGTLFRKIDYARHTLHCTMFYIDMNLMKLGTWDLVPVEFFAYLHREFPDCLLNPEHENTRYHQWTAPYRELRMGETGTPDEVRAVVNGAFSVINVTEGDIAGNFDKLVASVKAGDILMHNGWWADPKLKVLAQIYEAAG